MIAFITGNFVYKSPATIHVEAGGIGYEVQISLHTYSQIQHLDKGTILTWLHIKEDAHTLFGFADASEKSLFLQLISVNGVGTSTARMMLSALPPQELAMAIAAGNSAQLEKVKGIGKKSAERIILELKDKIGKNISNPSHEAYAHTNNTLELDALNALVALGIARNQADSAVKKATASNPSVDNLENLIKKALQLI